ncbi:hypothetical protein HDV00_011747 [Rhizophlyctis rosea]|nr:hypothetical protein HDV00_011747 [Rhizophlyctis rosea]
MLSNPPQNALPSDDKEGSTALGPVGHFLTSASFSEQYAAYGKHKSEANSPDHPFKSLYEARDVLISLKDALTKTEEGTEGELKRLSLAVLDHHLGVIHIQTEERSAGEKALGSSIVALRAHASDPGYCHVLIDSLNQLGILWEHRRAIEHLAEAEGLFNVFKRGGKGVPIQDPLDKRTAISDEERWKSFEDLHTHTLFFLAQVYVSGILPNDSQTTTADEGHKQIDMGIGLHEPIPILYVNVCLSASTSLPHLAKAKAEADGETVEENPLARAEADLAWIWGSFYLEALKTSVERYVDNDEEEDITAPTDDLSSHLAAMNLFDELELTPTRPTIPPNYATSSDEAKRLFLEGLTCLEKAKRFFVIDGFVTDHIQIVQAISQLYKCLAAFEKDPIRRSKLTKRRAELLTPLLNELNPHHFMDSVQSITYELAAIYEAIVDARMNVWERTAETKIYEDRVRDALEINELVNKSIKYYTDFIASYADPTTKMLPEPFQDVDDVKAVMTARWRVARLWARMLPVPSDPAKSDEKSLREMKANWLRRSYEQYERICNYDTRHGIPDFDQEMRVIREMRSLVPVHMREVMDGL